MPKTGRRSLNIKILAGDEPAPRLVTYIFPCKEAAWADSFKGARCVGPGGRGGTVCRARKKKVCGRKVARSSSREEGRGGGAGAAVFACGSLRRWRFINVCMQMKAIMSLEFWVRHPPTDCHEMLMSPPYSTPPLSLSLFSLLAWTDIPGPPTPPPPLRPKAGCGGRYRQKYGIIASLSICTLLFQSYGRTSSLANLAGCPTS